MNAINRPLAVQVRFSGLSGTGKTILSNHIADALRDAGLRVEHHHSEHKDHIDTLFVSVSREFIADDLQRKKIIRVRQEMERKSRAKGSLNL